MTRRSIVLDANILIRAVLGRRVRELIVEHAAGVSFFAPDVAFDEARKYLPGLLVKHLRHHQVAFALCARRPRSRRFGHVPLSPVRS